MHLLKGKKISMLFFSVLLAVAGCARVHPGVMADAVDDTGAKVSDEEVTPLGLKVSCKEDRDMRSKNFRLLYLTFENTTENWIRVDNVAIDFRNEKRNNTVALTSGRDLAEWHEATVRRNMIESHNRALFVGTIAALGVTLAVEGEYSGNKTAALVGGITALGAMTSLSIHEYSQQVNAIENGDIFPEHHLMAGEISIPPGLFVRRWIVLHSKEVSKQGQFRFFYLTYIDNADQLETIKIDMLKNKLKRTGRMKPWSS